MTLIKTTRVTGFTQIDDINLNLDFELNENVPGNISFHLNTENLSMGGLYSKKQIINYYVNNGIADRELIDKIKDTLISIEEEYSK